jgi:hypothetical protein
MLSLPLDHPEPFAATLGVMLYPGSNDDDPPKARAFTARLVAESVKRATEAGCVVPRDILLCVVKDVGWVLPDLDNRLWGGTATGELFKTLFALANTNTTLASWNNAIKVFELVAARESLARPHKAKGSHTELSNAKRRFLSVAHLWAAWCIREGRFSARPEAGCDGYDDFQSFLIEAEILRGWGQTWRPPRAKSLPFLPTEVWRVSEAWPLPPRPAGWPDRGAIPVLTLAEKLMAALKPAGRPRNTT